MTKLVKGGEKSRPKVIFKPVSHTVLTFFAPQFIIFNEVEGKLKWTFLKLIFFLTGRWCRWQARFGGSFLSVAEQQQIHIFFFLQPPEQIHILPRKPPCHLHPPNSTQLAPSLSPLGAGFWLWAGCGVAEDSAGQSGRVERVTAWRGLNIWDGTDMLMYTTHLILFAENVPSLQLSLRAKANKTFTCDIILLTVC